MIVFILQRFFSRVSAKSNDPDWIYPINAPKWISQTTRHCSPTWLSSYCRDSLADCQEKAMTQIKFAPSMLQNESHKPRDTVHPHDCLHIAEILEQSVSKKQWPRLNLPHQRSKMNLTNHEALFTHMIVFILQRFLSRVSEKAMTQIKSAPSTLQNESHKPRDTVHPHYCLHIAEILEQSVSKK